MDSEINNDRMSAGEVGFRGVIDSMGFRDKWSDLSPERQQLWNDAVENWIVNQCRTPEFLQLLQGEMGNLMNRGPEGPTERHPAPIRQSNSFLMAQLARSQLEFEYAHNKMLGYQQDASLYRQEHQADDSEQLTKEWICEELRSNDPVVWVAAETKLEFRLDETRDSDPKMFIVYAIGQYQEFAILSQIGEISTRGDFRRLARALRFEWEECDD
jgi:hypothetical protein